MLNFLPKKMILIIASLLLVTNVLFWCLFLFVFALLKLMIPFKKIRSILDRTLTVIAESWIACNSGWMRLTQRTHWDVEGLERLNYKGWYVINCNHQSAADIFVLQHLLNYKIPFLKFFIKGELFYVPIMGLAWWALDFPYMKRHSREHLARHPEKRKKDLETARKACEKYKRIPTSVMNFSEGTRFSKPKHDRQQSPYTHLLKPKAGAMALAINTLGDRIHSLLDITIVYPDGEPTFWEFLSGRVKRVIVRARQLPVPEHFMDGDYENDPQFRALMQQWLHHLWLEKDRQIGLLMAQANPA
jgi:1-acyl-sn-glycerol-3-phosphate acyltransferase